MTVVLSAAAVCTPAMPRPGWVAIDDGRIVETGSDAHPRHARDLGDVLLVPGYLDLQVNGVGDVDFATAAPSEWEDAGRVLLTHGVTAYCPTIVSATLDSYAPALERSARARTDAATSHLPAVLGVHLEGPFLGDVPGAHPTELLRPVDIAWLEDLVAAHTDLVRIVTLAPEADPGLAGIRRLVAAGVVVALGHSGASYDEAGEAAAAGARLVTHVFNGMTPLHHREPGLAGAALDDARLIPTVIADLVHVHPAVLRLIFGRRGDVALVSDAVAITDDVHEEDGAARLLDGTLAGAITLLDRAVANVVALGVPVERAIASATSVPADIVGATDRGRLAPGARADLLALDAATLLPRHVWLEGEEMPSQV